MTRMSILVCLALAEVYYDEDGCFGMLGASDPHFDVSTYEGHVWNSKADGEILAHSISAARKQIRSL
jgi:hypothetical protein